MAQASLLHLRTRNHTGQATDTLEQAVSLQPEPREDSHLAGRVERALHATGYMPLRNIEVAVCARVVNLAGRVASYYLKQVAQTAALGVPGIHRLQNDLQVV